MERSIPNIMRKDKINMKTIEKNLYGKSHLFQNKIPTLDNVLSDITNDPQLPRLSKTTLKVQIILISNHRRNLLTPFAE